MDMSEETQKMECLLETLYSELFPGTPLCSENHVHDSEATDTGGGLDEAHGFGPCRC